MSIDLDVLSRLINLAGRQRMLSQRLTLHVLLAANGQAGALSTCQALLGQLQHSQHLIEEGGEGLPGLFSAGLRDVFDGRGRARAQVASFITKAAQVLAVLNRGQPLGESLQAELVSQSSSVLEPLNHVTQAIEREAQQLARAQAQERERLNEEIRSVAREARVVAFNAQVSAHRAGPQGLEFAVVAARMATITEEIDQLAKASMAQP
jgi:methyl-accepting chemotaxis protein